MSHCIQKSLFAAPLLWAVSFCFAIPAAATDVDAAGYYKLRCATCHGASGEGTRDKSPSLGPPLRGNPLVINAPAEMLMGIIRSGRGGQQRVYDDAYPNMPAFDAGLVPDAMGLAVYLKTVLQGVTDAEATGAEEAQDTAPPVIASDAAARPSLHTGLAPDPKDGNDGPVHQSSLHSKGVRQ